MPLLTRSGRGAPNAGEGMEGQGRGKEMRGPFPKNVSTPSLNFWLHH